MRQTRTRLGDEERRPMDLVPAPAVRLMKRRVLSRPGVNSLKNKSHNAFNIFLFRLLFFHRLVWRIFQSTNPFSLFILAALFFFPRPAKNNERKEIGLLFRAIYLLWRFSFILLWPENKSRCKVKTKTKSEPKWNGETAKRSEGAFVFLISSGGYYFSYAGYFLFYWRLFVSPAIFSAANKNKCFRRVPPSISFGTRLRPAAAERRCRRCSLLIWAGFISFYLFILPAHSLVWKIHFYLLAAPSFIFGPVFFSFCRFSLGPKIKAAKNKIRTIKRPALFFCFCVYLLPAINLFIFMVAAVNIFGRLFSCCRFCWAENICRGLSLFLPGRCSFPFASASLLLPGYISAPLHFREAPKKKRKEKCNEKSAFYFGCNEKIKISAENKSRHFLLHFCRLKNEDQKWAKISGRRPIMCSAVYFYSH